MINDLAINNALIWKYVDHTTESKVIRKGQVSNAQTIADEVAEWSNRKRVKLNIDKCNKLRIHFPQSVVSSLLLLSEESV